MKVSPFRCRMQWQEATLVAHRFRQTAVDDWILRPRYQRSFPVSVRLTYFTFAGHALEGGGHIGLLLGSAHEGTQTQFLSPNSLCK